jgi:hypothetical protein
MGDGAPLPSRHDLKDLGRRHRSAPQYAALARGDYPEIAYQRSPFNIVDWMIVLASLG